MHAIATPRPAAILKACLGLLAQSLAIGTFLLAGPVRADEPTPDAAPQALNRIDLQGQSSGSLMVNTAAGDSNQQQNVLAIAHATTGVAQATVDSRQDWQVGGAARLGPLQGGNYSARIDGTSFRGAQGLTAVNQSAGAGNQQVNAVAIAIGPSATATVAIAQANDAVLGQVAAAQDGQSGGQPATGRRTLSIDGSAFSGASGIVQVNQIAGVGNRTSNVVTFAIAN